MIEDTTIVCDTKSGTITVWGTEVGNFYWVVQTGAQLMSVTQYVAPQYVGAVCVSLFLVVTIVMKLYI